MTTPATPATLRLLSAFHYESARANLGYARVLRRFGAEAAAASAILRARESRRLARAARSHPDTEHRRCSTPECPNFVPLGGEGFPELCAECLKEGDRSPATPPRKIAALCPACRGVGLVHNCRPR